MIIEVTRGPEEQCYQLAVDGTPVSSCESGAVADRLWDLIYSGSGAGAVEVRVDDQNSLTERVARRRG